jgi:hypothetical protein
MSIRDKLKKAASLFVELSPDEPETPAPAETDNPLDWSRLTAEAEERAHGQGQTKTVEQIVQQTAGPNLDEIHVPDQPVPPVVSSDGKLDVQVIYKQASLPTVSFTAEQVLEMLTSLPTELPLGVRRQTVKATLSTMGKTIGATPETVVADASRKLAALSAYTEAMAKQTAEFGTSAQLEIAALQAQIEEKRRAIDARQKELSMVIQLCEQEADRLDDILEFFSTDAPPSKYAEPQEKQ